MLILISLCSEANQWQQNLYNPLCTSYITNMWIVMDCQIGALIVCNLLAVENLEIRDILIKTDWSRQRLELGDYQRAWPSLVIDQSVQSVHNMHTVVQSNSCTHTFSLWLWLLASSSLWVRKLAKVTRGANTRKTLRTTNLMRLASPSLSWRSPVRRRYQRKSG